jgi:hypothetical protein
MKYGKIDNFEFIKSLKEYHEHIKNNEALLQEGDKTYSLQLKDDGSGVIVDSREPLSWKDFFDRINNISNAFLCVRCKKI